MQTEQISARFVPKSLDKKARTVDVVFSTGAPVLRKDPRYGAFWEELEISDEGVDLTRIAAGGPVLDSHSSESIRHQIGVVEKAWIENQTALATIRFSAREEVERIFCDIADGILQNISVGYEALNTEELDRGEDGKPRIRLTKWRPLEISLVPVPADPKAQVRSLPLATPPSLEPVMTPENIRSEILKEERSRQTQIRTLCRQHGQDTGFEDDLISRGLSVEDARKTLLDKLCTSQPEKRPVVEVYSDDGEKWRSNVVAALEYNYGDRSKEPAENARGFVNRSCS